MARNHEVTKEQLLLDDNGELREPGWSKSLVQRYDRSMIKAPKWRIKEWDYYLVMSDKFAGAFTISDDGYIGLQSVSLLTFGDEPWEHTQTVLNPFPMGRINLPEDSSVGTTKYMDKRLKMKFDGVVYEFNREKDFGTLDWGRGVWTYDNTWLWGSGNADLDGNRFGFNIGYGFGNTSAATENAIFYIGEDLYRKE